MSVTSSVITDQGERNFFKLFNLKSYKLSIFDNMVIEPIEEPIEITTPKSTGTFIRFEQKNFKPTAHCCHICRYNFKSADDLNNHLKLHRSKVVLRMSALSER